jgi:glycyl-tRNA synthetase beta chain
MLDKSSLLVEIHTEELPPKTLLRLSASFLMEIEKGLQLANLTYGHAKAFATPRRLSVSVTGLLNQQADIDVERKGPSVQAAYDAQGNPTPASLGFAKSCGVNFAELIRLKSGLGEWLGYKQRLAGKKLQELLPEIVSKALQALPAAKKMRWGMGKTSFVRPVHTIILLLDNEIIPATILGVATNNKTYGHRFHSQQELEVAHADDYEKILEEKGFVIADFAKRRALIEKQVADIMKQHFNGTAVAKIDAELLNEVTALVEWPVALIGNFSKEFLTVPAEALISAMQDHQRYFPVLDLKGRILPHFITISNIKSRDANHVIAGNERVIKARLSDAAFFFGVDKKISLESRLALLKTIIYQAKLGSLFDKSERLAKLSLFIAKKLHVDVSVAERAGLLAKTDLTSQIVNEFPDLQGIAGYYYALHDKESLELAESLTEQYLPRFANDSLPTSLLGCVLAIADRMDILVGFFGINQIPTGDKDPYGLRRAALGILRIIIEKSLNIDLVDLIAQSVKLYADKLQNNKLEKAVLDYILERLRAVYAEQKIEIDVFSSVMALSLSQPLDIDKRVQAVHKFKQLPEASALAAANKRVSNILAKQKISDAVLKEDLLQEVEEKDLAKHLASLQTQTKKLASDQDYAELLQQLASLRRPVDQFFDKVMVMTEDVKLRENRLILLRDLRQQFLQVADIALLQVE